MERSYEYFRRYVTIFRRWAWLLVASSLLAGASAYFFSQRVTPIYQAQTTLLVSEAPATAAADYTDLRTSERLAFTYAELMTKDPVIEAVAARLGLRTPLEDIKDAIQVRTVSDTQLLVIRAEDADPTQAARIANTLAEVFIEQNRAQQAARYAATKSNLEDQMAALDAQIKSSGADLAAFGAAGATELGAAVAGLPESPQTKVERTRLENLLAQYRQAYTSLLSRYEEVRMAEAQSTSNLSIVEPARAPKTPLRPDVLLNVSVALVFGLVLGGVLVAGFEVLNDRVGDPRETSEHLGLAVLGLIASHDTGADGPVAMVSPRAPVVEAFRALRTNLQFSGVDRELKTILVTSPSPGEGKSLVAANLAAVLAQGEQRALLVDADLRRPTLHKIFRLHNRHGFSSMLVQLRAFLEGKVSHKKAIQNVGAPGLGVLTSGRLPPNPAELLASSRTGALLDLLATGADVVVIDSPPVLAVTDAAVLAPRMDGVLLVIKPGVTRLAEAREAVEQLRRVGANLLGLVFNDVDVRCSGYYYYKYKDYYYSGENAERVVGRGNGRLRPVHRAR